MKVFENKFLQIFIETENNIIIGYWTQETEDAEHDDFKNWNSEIIKIMEQYNPKKFLANTIDHKFKITPDLQEWSVVNVFGRFAKAGIRKLAMVTTDDLFSQVSMEQFTDEYQDGDIVTKYFDNKEKARNWLIEK